MMDGKGLVPAIINLILVARKPYISDCLTTYLRQLNYILAE